MTTPSLELAKLTRLLNTPDLAALVVRVVIQGQIQVEAEGTSHLDIVKVLLEPDEPRDLLQYAPAQWWLNSSSLFSAVGNGWIEIPAETQQISPIVVVPTAIEYIQKPPNAAIGDLLVFDGINWVSLPTGPAGRILTSGGPGTTPSYQIPEPGTIEVQIDSGVVGTSHTLNFLGPVVVGGSNGGGINNIELQLATGTVAVTSTPYTIDLAYRSFYVDVPGPAVVQLPAASAVRSQLFIVKTLTNNGVTITPGAGDTIDGAPSASLGAAYSTVILQSASFDLGVTWNWFKIKAQDSADARMVTYDTTSSVLGNVVRFSAAKTVTDAVATSKTAARAIGIVTAVGALPLGKVQVTDEVTANLIPGLTLAEGDSVYVSKTLGQLTNDWSGFVTGDVIAEVGIIADASTYDGVSALTASVLLSGKSLVFL